MIFEDIVGPELPSIFDFVATDHFYHVSDWAAPLSSGLYWVKMQQFCDIFYGFTNVTGAYYGGVIQPLQNFGPFTFQFPLLD